MTRPATLADAWQQRAAEHQPSRPVPPAVQARRDFYAGALAAAQLPRDQVLRECMDWMGRPTDKECLTHGRTDDVDTAA